MNSNDTLAHYELACIRAAQERVADALKHLIASINGNPLFVKGYFVLGGLLTVAGKPEEAIDVYRKGLQYVPDAHLLREQLSGLLAAKGMFQEAISETHECIRRRKSYDDHLRLGIYSVISGQFEIAEKAFLKSLELNPENWEAHYNLGELYSAANLGKESREQYESAISKGKNEWKPYNGMGTWILRNGQNPKEAIPFFQKANQLDSSRPEPHMNLALTFASSREWDAAKGQCNALMQKVPSDSRYFMEAERLLHAIDSEIRELN
jgi:tetratricopeptide (TPR) repeat protein